MELQAQGFEHRLGELEAQIDRLNAALQHWRDAQDHLRPMEQRLTQLTDQCADVLKQWSATGERHAVAVGELEARLTGWNEVETRLQREASSRFQALERVIEQEWATLRHLHEEPARQLRAQAESLTEICVTTAGSAQTGLERAEARLATIERDLHRRMDELSRDLHATVAELRHRNEASTLRGPASPWSLDEVTRLHHELRDGAPARGNLTGAEPAVVESPVTSLAPRVTAPMFGSAIDGTPVQAVAEPRTATPDAASAPVDDAPAPRTDWRWYAAVAVLAVAAGISVVFAMSFYRQAGTAAAQASQASQAQQHAEQIATAANQRIEAARQDAATSIAQARETASKAQVTSDVLAASDLVRFNLVGGEGANRSSAQLLWSRSRGMVFSGSRLPPPPAGSMYQIWLLSADRAVSAGTFVPDGSGRATSATDTPPNAPRPLTGVSVTLEPAPGRQEPSGAIVLARAQ
jgi:hypothetical protein